jgi:hypothetical protein
MISREKPAFIYSAEFLKKKREGNNSSFISYKHLPKKEKKFPVLNKKGDLYYTYKILEEV